jgi:hypothetical protein
MNQPDDGGVEVRAERRRVGREREGATRRRREFSNPPDGHDGLGRWWVVPERRGRVVREATGLYGLDLGLRRAVTARQGRLQSLSEIRLRQRADHPFHRHRGPPAQLRQQHLPRLSARRRDSRVGWPGNREAQHLDGSLAGLVGPHQPVSERPRQRGLDRGY